MDFGAGTGLFLERLRNRRDDLHLYGIEPYMTTRPSIANFVPSFAAIGDYCQDVVTAFEVCEHLYDDELREFVGESFRVLHKAGKLIISVPVTYGPIVLLKEMNRMLFLGKFDYSAKDLLAAAAGRSVARADDIKVSHKGFDFRELASVLEPRFVIQETIYSPFPRLPWWANSQVFFVCAKAAR